LIAIIRRAILALGAVGLYQHSQANWFNGLTGCAYHRS